MKNIIFTLSIAFASLLFSCSTFEKEKLYGEWQNKNWHMVFEEDGSCKIGKNGEFQSGDWTYTKFGNTIELVRNGKVFLTNLTVKEVTQENLSLEFRNVSGDNLEKVEILKKVD